ncbi:site-specific recombinase [Serratia marcescens]|uniref:site-specific recombinase n=1 Tax=Serratia marcescens TaxID=615 RepID=UPI003D16FCD8
MIGVLIDHDSQAMTDTGPALYFDLGELYCTNPFWSSCPHRMACIGCDFSLPKSSARAVALERRASIRRYLEEVPLTPDEQAIVAGDIEKLHHPQSFRHTGDRLKEWLKKSLNFTYVATHIM